MTKFAILQVYNERCAECLFSKNKIVSDSRRREILAQCARDDSHFVCHKASILCRNVVCRGFYDTRSTNAIRIAGRLDALEFIDLPSDEEV